MEADAENALVHLEWGEAVRSLDSLTEAHAKLVREYRDLVADFRGSSAREGVAWELDRRGHE